MRQARNCDGVHRSTALPPLATPHDRILESLHPQFDAAYRTTGRPSVPPKRLLKALLLMAIDKGPGKGAKLSQMGHVLAENRHGLILTITTTEASGTAEREATISMLDELQATHGRVPRTLGGDKGFDDSDFFGALEKRKLAPVAG